MTNLPPPPADPSIPPPTPGEGSWFSALFDLSFERLITPRLIKVLFLLGLVVASIYAIAIFAVLASQGGGAVVLGLILAPLIWLVFVIGIRVTCEVYLVLFKIERNTRDER